MSATAIRAEIARWSLAPWDLTHDSARRVWKARAVAGRVRLTVESEDVGELRDAVVALRGQTLVVP